MNGSSHPEITIRVESVTADIDNASANASDSKEAKVYSTGLTKMGAILGDNVRAKSLERSK